VGRVYTASDADNDYTELTISWDRAALLGEAT